MSERICQAMQALYDRPDVKIFTVERKPELLAELQSLEKACGRPISASDPRFPRDKFFWVDKGGLFHFKDKVDKNIVFVVRITYVPHLLLCKFT